MDTNGIKRYLVVVFVLGYALQIGSLAGGLLDIGNPNFFQWILLTAIMFVPAVSALIAMLTGGENEAGEEAQLFPIPVKPAFLAALLPVILFALIYGIPWIVGIQQLDFTMHEAIAKMRELSPEELPNITGSTVGYLLLSVGLPFSVVLGATLFALAGFGQEYGWRGYLLPRLAPLGRLRAHFLTGAFSILWALPTLYAAFKVDLGGAQLYLSLLRVFAVLLFVGVVSGELTLKHKKLSLGAILAGGFLCQHFAGVWTYLFPMGYGDYTGSFGYVAIVVWALAAGVLFKFGEKQNATGDRG